MFFILFVSPPAISCFSLVPQYYPVYIPPRRRRFQILSRKDLCWEANTYWHPVSDPKLLQAPVLLKQFCNFYSLQCFTIYYQVSLTEAQDFTLGQ